jgi:hypothetical protein
MQQLTNESQLLRGYTMPTSTSSSYTGPIPGAYAASPLQQIAGLGALGAGISNTELGKTLFGTADSRDPKTGALIEGTRGILGKGLGSIVSGGKDIYSGIFGSDKGSMVSTDNPNPIKGDDGQTLMPRGDGTYTDPSGKIVDSFGDPITIFNPDAYDPNSYGDAP